MPSAAAAAGSLVGCGDGDAAGSVTGSCSGGAGSVSSESAADVI